ncbi:MAG: GNAT family N-acetyltransferase [Flavobacteriales bacterium]
MGLFIEEITSTELSIVRDLSHAIWPICYANIITEAQIKYMLEKMYSLPALETAHNDGQRFLLAYLDSKPVGYAGFEIEPPDMNHCKLHKLYVLPNLHGSGIGKELLMKTQNLADASNCQSMFLQVNKKNPAVQFYQKMGMYVREEVVFDIGNGFVMDDFIMQLDW